MSHEYGLSEEDMGIESKKSMQDSLEQLMGQQKMIEANLQELVDNLKGDQDRRAQLLSDLPSKIEQNHERMLS